MLSLQVSRFCLSLMLGLVGFASGAARAEGLLVGAAASLQDVMTAVGAEFQRQQAGAKVAFQFGASSELVQQALHHAPLDVVMTADEATMDTLAARSLLQPGERFDIVANRMLLVVNRASQVQVKELADLLQPKIKRLALCAPEVPIGHYAYQLLDGRQLTQRLKPKIVQAANVRAALALIASGAADAGFVYATDLRAGGERIAVAYDASAASGLEIRYPAAVLKDSRQRPLAQQFLRFLHSAKAQGLFADAGFKPLSMRVGAAAPLR